jgi:DNA polymerase-1
MIYFVTNRTNNLVVDSDKVKVQLIGQVNVQLVGNSDKLPPLNQLTYKGTNLVGLDLETTGLSFYKDDILLIVLGNETDQYVLDWYGLKNDSNFKLSDLFQDSKLSYLGHNLLFDLPFLIHRGVDFSIDQVCDTMIAEQILIKGTKKSASLKDTLKRRLGITEVNKAIRMEFVAMKNVVPIFDNRHIEYASGDIEFLSAIYGKQNEHLTRLKQLDLLDLNNKNVGISAKMGLKGMYVDRGAWMKLYYANLKKADELEIRMDEELVSLGFGRIKKRVKVRFEQTDLFGGIGVDVVNKNINHLNYASPAQCLDVFKAFNLPIPKSVKEDKKSVGEATLQQYLLNHPTTLLKDWIKLLIEYKVTLKLTKSFGKKWLEEHLDENSRVHATFVVNRTATGRFLAKNPNLQQIPSIKEFRQCFKAPQGRKIWTCDYSSAELRILASLSRDEAMLRILSEGGDLHGYVATPVYRYLFKDETAIVDKNNNGGFRTKMKNVIFGLLYGAGVNKIAELLDISSMKAEQVYQILQKTFPEAFDYLDKMSSFGVNNGYIIIEPILNQRRWFQEYFDNGGYLTKSEKGSVERACKNTPIQATNGQMMKQALIYVDNYITENKLSSFIVSTVHDEMVVEVGEGEEPHVEAFKSLMKKAGDEFLSGVEMEVEDKVLECWSK